MFDDNDSLVIKTDGGRYNVRRTDTNGTNGTTASANVAPPLGRVPTYKSMMETITGNKMECFADGLKGTNCHIIKNKNVRTNNNNVQKAKQV